MTKKQSCGVWLCKFCIAQLQGALLTSKSNGFSVSCPVFWEIAIQGLQEAVPFSISGQQARQSFLHSALEGLHGWAALSAPSLIRAWRTAICDYSYIL